MLMDGLIQLLGSSESVAALVGNRIYEDVLPRNYEFPALVLHAYNGAQESGFQGPTGVREQNIQADAYGNTAEQKRQLREAVRNVLIRFVGPLPEGTVVQGCFLEREQDMPYVPNVNLKGFAFRSIAGYRVVTPQL